MSGLFITFEGPDGSGKSTLIKKLENTLFQDFKDLEVVFTREPGGTNNQIAEDIRNLLLNKMDYKIDYHAEALLFSASRAQHVKDFIQPSLEANKIVLCDRYVDSSIVYQGFGRGLGAEAIWKINEFAMHGVVPHLTLILMVTPEVGMERIMANSLREVNRLDKEKVEMHQKVYQAYRYIIDNDKTERIVEIDASGDVDTVFNHVYNVVKQKINQLYGK